MAVHKGRNSMIRFELSNQRRNSLVEPLEENDLEFVLDEPFRFIGCQFKTISIPVNTHEDWLIQFSDHFINTDLRPTDTLPGAKALRDDLRKLHERFPGHIQQRIGKFTKVATTMLINRLRDRLRKSLAKAKKDPPVKLPCALKRGFDYGGSTLEMPKTAEQKQNEEIENLG